MSFSTGVNLEALLIQFSKRETVKYLETRVIPVYGKAISVHWAGAILGLKILEDDCSSGCRYSVS